MVMTQGERSKRWRSKHEKHVQDYNFNYKKEHYDKYIKSLQKTMHNLKINGCAICGYNECQDALCFHHTNPDDKNFGIIMCRLTSTDKKLVDELNKCILLCANCHYEIHYKERKQMEKDKNE